MSTTVTYKRTRRLHSSFVRQFFWRVAVTPLIVIIIFAVLCWGCISTIIQLYGFFSNTGVVDIWYHLFVSFPLALFSVLFLIAMIKLVKQLVMVNYICTRMHESCPIHEDNVVNVEVKIDDDGIGLGKNKEQWDEMTLGLETKDFYAFLSKRPVLIGIPKYTVEAELGEYLKTKVKKINKRLKGRMSHQRDAKGSATRRQD